MKTYQKDFIDIAIASKALCFGEYELKSGRKSPYFFNAGLLYQGRALAALAKSYAQAIVDSQIHYDVIFGPAYKGIPLAAITAAALYEHHGIDIPFAYNRKEKKSHGEGGQLVGPQLAGKKVLIIDDVITAGTAIREVKALLEEEGAELAGVVIGLNRQERGKTDLSAIEEVERDFGVTVISIINLSNIVHYLESCDEQKVVEEIKNYRTLYGVDL